MMSFVQLKIENETIIKGAALEKNLSRMDEFEIFKKAIQCISSSLDLDQVLQQLLDLLKNYIPMNDLTLFHHDYSKNRYERLGYASLDADYQHRTFPEYLYIENSVELVKNSFQSGKSVIVVNGPETDPIAREAVRYTGSKNQSFMGLLLVHHQNWLGALVSGWDKRDVYDKDHEALFCLLREPMALALSNSIRFQEIMDLKNQFAIDNQELTKKLSSRVEENVIGADAGLKSVMEKVHSVAPLDSSVLIQGETGVGKEVIANAIKNLSDRKDAPFFKIDCGSIPETLIESELFGHEKGAFTGAVTQKRGSFELADGGTVFMDEIGELSPAAQVKFLRLLQDREIVRVGGQKVISLDIRIICATHRNLEEMVGQGLFREDLWYRLNVFPIKLPPLRERKQDIPALVSYLVSKKAREMNLDRAPALSNLELTVLASYDWPGNIRELENVLERWLILGCGAVSFQAILNPSQTEVSESQVAVSGFDRINDPKQIISLDELNKQYIESALTACNNKVGGKGGLAERLGIPRSTLRSRMKKLGVRTHQAGKTV